MVLTRAMVEQMNVDYKGFQVEPEEIQIYIHICVCVIKYNCLLNIVSVTFSTTH